MLEPRGIGRELFTLRDADEFRVLQFGSGGCVVDAEMVATARAIIKQRTGKFDTSEQRDRYEEGLRELIEAKMKGVFHQAERALSTHHPSST